MQVTRTMGANVQFDMAIGNCTCFLHPMRSRGSTVSVDPRWVRNANGVTAHTALITIEFFC